MQRAGAQDRLVAGREGLPGAIHRNGVRLPAFDEYLTDAFGLEAVEKEDTSPKVVQVPISWHQAAMSDGEQLYTELCAVCHGVEGVGDGPAAKAQQYVGIDLVHPAIQFVDLAKSLGVHGVRAEGAGDFQQALKDALDRPGPTLIDVAIEADFPTA